MDAGHLLTFLRAAIADIGAALAVVDLVGAAFLAAGVADLGAQTADLLGKL